MINTQVINNNPPIVYHRVSGRINEEEAATGAKHAISVANALANKQLKFGLILDMRGYLFENLTAHKIWSIGFKEQQLLKENITKAAIVGDNTPRFQAEKNIMETDALKFFCCVELATDWLKET